MILIKKFQESLTSIVFHATSVNNVLDILKTDRFALTTNLGTSSDKIGEKWYYMSFSTIKWGGYSRSLSFAGQAILVIDGDRLNQKYKGIPVDYWGSSFRPRGGDAEQSNQSLRNDENEERLVTDDPEIPNASKYIKEIHICFTNEEITDPDKVGIAFYDYKEGRFRLDDIRQQASARNIPCYFYSSPKAFMSLDKRKALQGWDRTSTIQALIDIYEHYLGKSLHELPNKYPYDRIIRALYQAKNSIEQESKYQDQEFINGIMADIHNGKSSASGRITIGKLTSIMQKEKVRGLWDLIVSMASKMEKE